MQTRLLNPQIFLDYLDLYQKYREKDRTSALGWLKATVSTGVSKVTREDPVIKKIDNIFAEVKAEIKNAKDFKSWIEVILTLREKASAAQNLKTLNEPALSWLTLQATADFIILELEKEPELEKGNEFKRYMACLNEELIKLEIDRRNDIKTGQGKGVIGINKKKDAILKELAMLGDLCATDEAIHRNLLDATTLIVPEPGDLVEYECSVDANYAAPLCLQPNFCEWLYGLKFQSIKKVSFLEFRLEAIDNSEELSARKKMQEQVEANKQLELEALHRLKRESVKSNIQNEAALAQKTDQPSTKLSEEDVDSSSEKEKDKDLPDNNDKTNETKLGDSANSVSITQVVGTLYGKKSSAILGSEEDTPTPTKALRQST